MAEVAAKMPLDKMLLETDCPYLTPEPHRGQRNEPAYIAFIAQKVAELRQMSLEELKLVTFQNTQELFGIKMA